MKLSDLKMYFPSLYVKYEEIVFKKTYRYQQKLLNRSPKALVEYIYNKNFNKVINLENPKTFNEKLNWLKLNWYDENARICSDKYLVRNYVREKGLAHLLNPLCGKGVYSDPKQIDVNELPDRFVLKATHDSGHNIICTDKSMINWKIARKKMKWWLEIDYSIMSGEWAYYNNNPGIICEEFLEDKENGELLDYKFFCFNGRPELIFLASDRKNHAKSDFYDLDWNKLPFRWLYEPSGKIFKKPKRLKEMIEYATKLSEDFPFVRVDFYEVEGRVYFGELTFFHGGGCGWFKPESVDFELGEKIILPPIKQNPWDEIGKGEIF